MASKLEEYKILVVGDSGIGKTNFVNTFAKGRHAYSDVYITTVGSELSTKKIRVNEEDVLLKIWDLSGANEYRTNIVYQFKDIDGIMLCYSATSERSWENVENWIKTFHYQIGDEEFKKKDKLLIGLKYDLQHFSTINDSDVALKCSTLLNTNAFLTSSKNYKNVQEAFYAIAESIYFRHHMKSASSGSTFTRKPARKSLCWIL